uniref:Uncharacterized protein n=1 Tax=Lepeophtheirus salmonis TaxID=72036 RepID=A0A0K2U0I0_LEPSM
MLEVDGGRLLESLSHLTYSSAFVILSGTGYMSVISGGFVSIKRDRPLCFCLFPIRESSKSIMSLHVPRESMMQPGGRPPFGMMSKTRLTGERECLFFRISLLFANL